MFTELVNRPFPINNNMPISLVCCEDYVAKWNTVMKTITFASGTPWKNPYCCP